jgi:hypothetical protein
LKRTFDPSPVQPDRPETRAAPHSVSTPPRVTRLKSLDDVRVELGKVYREARIGRLEMGEAKGLAYLLSIMSALLKETALEGRVSALEQAADGHGGTA